MMEKNFQSLWSTKLLLDVFFANFFHSTVWFWFLSQPLPFPEKWGADRESALPFLHSPSLSESGSSSCWQTKKKQSCFFPVLRRCSRFLGSLHQLGAVYPILIIHKHGMWIRGSRIGNKEEHRRRRSEEESQTKGVWDPVRVCVLSASLRSSRLVPFIHLFIEPIYIHGRSVGRTLRLVSSHCY